MTLFEVSKYEVNEKNIESTCEVCSRESRAGEMIYRITAPKGELDVIMCENCKKKLKSL